MVDRQWSVLASEAGSEEAVGELADRLEIVELDSKPAASASVEPVASGKAYNLPEELSVVISLCSSPLIVVSIGSGSTSADALVVSVGLLKLGSAGARSSFTPRPDVCLTLPSPTTSVGAVLRWRWPS